eukprot:g11543.t1
MAQSQATLVKWINGFDIVSPKVKFEDLADGIVLTKVLHAVAPSYFSEAKAGEAGAIKALLDQLAAFFEDTSTASPIDPRQVSVSLVVAKHEGELTKLLQLVLLAAIHAEHKQIAIEVIMALGESEQEQLMNVISMATGEEDPEMGTPHTEGGDHLGEDEDPFAFASGVARRPADYPRGSTGRLTDMMLKGDEWRRMEEQVTSLQAQNAQLEAKNTALARENKAQLKDMEEIRSHRDSVASSSEAEQKQMASELAALRDKEARLTKSEAALKKALDAANARAESLEEEKEQLKSRLETLNKRATTEKDELISAGRELQDELELAKSKLTKLRKLEEQVKNYKKKIEESTEQKRQLQEYSASAEENVRKIVELEEKLRETESIKEQLSEARRKAKASEARASEAHLREEEKDAEISELKEKLAQLEKQSKFQSQQEAASLSSLASLPSPDAEGGAGLTESGLSAEVRNKIMRLEAENKLLKERTASSKGSEDQVRELSEALELQGSQYKAMEAKAKKQLEVIRKQKATIEQQKATIEEKKQASPENFGLTGLTLEQQEELAQLRQKNAALEKALSVHKRGREQKAQEATLLKTSLSRAEAKAQNVINDRTEQFHEVIKGYKDEKMALEKKLKFWQNKAERLTEEQRLMSTAFHSLGLEFHSAYRGGRQAVPSNRHRQKAWLAQQRNATYSHAPSKDEN